MGFRDVRLSLSPSERRRLNRALRRELRSAGMPESWGRGRRAETKILMLGLLRMWNGPGARGRRRGAREVRGASTPQATAAEVSQPTTGG